MIKYWLKIVTSEENKYIKHIYNLMLKDMDDQLRKQIWALSVKTYYMID